MDPLQTTIGQIADPRERLLAFTREREAIRLRRQAVAGGRHAVDPGIVPRWTKDPILAAYRFCNVRREDDRVTRWIDQHWRRPNAGDPDLWFAMVVARFVNWPDTLEHLGYPVPWDPLRFLSVMQTRRLDSLKVYGGAYMIRADSGQPGRRTADYQAEVVFGPLWRSRALLQPGQNDTLNSYHVLLGQFHGLGSFMAAQVVADLKYVEPLRSASDWMTFAASGPGSRRGLNRVLERPVKSPWTEDEWRLELGRLQDWFNQSWRLLGHKPLHAQDIQNCLCEFDKYSRVLLGEGRPRARFP